MELDQIDVSRISDEDEAPEAIATPQLRQRGPIKAPPRLKITSRTRQSAGMRFARTVFAIAGVYGLAATAPLFFIEKQLGIDHPAANPHPEFYYGFAGLCLAWQVLFLIIAANPIRLRPAMIASIIEKVSFPMAIVPLFMLGRVGMLFLGAAAVDAFFAIAFGMAYFSCKPKN